MDFSKSNPFTLTAGGKTALVDADIIARACASAADGRHYTIKEEIEAGKWAVYHICKYKKDAVAFCETNELDKSCIYIGYKPDPVANCLHSVKLMFQDILTTVSAGAYIGYLTGKSNFRFRVAKTVPYKGTRWSKKQREMCRKAFKWIDWLNATEESYKEARRPAHLDACREYLINNFSCIESVDEEADDMMGIAQSDDTIICSIDKDLRTVAGLHYSWNKGTIDEVSEEQATRNFYEQLLKGDTTDNIIGLYGIGDKKATKFLADCVDEEEMFNVCLCMYGGDYDRLLENGQLLYIRQEEGEIWQPRI